MKSCVACRNFGEHYLCTDPQVDQVKEKHDKEYLERRGEERPAKSKVGAMLSVRITLIHFYRCRARERRQMTLMLQSTP